MEGIGTIAFARTCFVKEMRTKHEAGISFIHVPDIYHSNIGKEIPRGLPKVQIDEGVTAFTEARIFSHKLILEREPGEEKAFHLKFEAYKA